ncbi:unnamed protein product [Didymodactylos carnosus]|uniref:Uncharacterized protein n=1 Tax=Didymodactylos carnosus TaxID=1234261 RepID=A0A814MXZ2_9BILA|nr:unnamed protein product [Didymodactylos carnosus]CAF1084578.1 unnamed protein product [Didymodactylos carnosus]CAF3700081.1 unnamed protein product [Didymodactylos carnosus]CAF3850221.1 unnamed protein product [Didymodactylos carnosus]
MPLTEAAKEEMLHELLERLESKDSDLTDICIAVNWSTRLHRSFHWLINTAFRTENVTTLFKLRYFIIELHNQTQQSYQSFIASLLDQDHLITYCGQLMARDQLELLKNNIGGFVLINSFLSTTRLLNVARTYAGNGSAFSAFESIILEIDIDVKRAMKTFSSLNAEDKDEILFSIGCVSKIRDVKLIKAHV